MPLLQTYADMLSQTDLVRGVIEEIVDRDDLFALLNFVHTQGKSYTYNREATLSQGTFLSPYDAVPEGAMTFTEVTTNLRIIAGDVDLDKFLLTTESDTNDQLAVQIAGKVKGIARTFRSAIINGSNAANAKSFDGLAVLTPNEQTIVAATNGAPVTFSMLDQLRDLVINGADCFMMRRSTWRAIKALLRTVNGNDGAMIQIANFGRPMPAFDGTPVILNDYIPNNETCGTNANTTSIYALRLNEADGFHGLFGGPTAGFQLEEVGTVQNMDAVRWRVKWYCGVALKSTLSVGRLMGVTNV